MWSEIYKKSMQCFNLIAINESFKVFYLFQFLIIFNMFSVENLQTYDQPIAVLTTQKSGTHLLLKALHMIINSKNLENHGIILRHIDIEPELCREDGYKKMLLIRDPRDIYIAQIYFMQDHSWYENHPWIKSKDLYESFNQWPFDERLAWVITHPEEYLGVGGAIKQSLELMKNFSVFVIRFEDLVGPLGGGDRMRQETTIGKIALFIGYSLSQNEIKHIADHLFGDTNSFRKGQIGAWLEHFSLDHKESFKKFMGQELIDLGYVKNNDW